MRFFGDLLGTGATKDKRGPTATVAATLLNLRSRPDENAPILGQLNNETIVKITASKLGWIQVLSSHGKGWVSSQFVRINEVHPEEVKERPSLASAIGQIGFILGFALSVLYIGLSMLYRLVPMSLVIGFIMAVVGTIIGNVAAWLLAERAGITNPYHWFSILTLSVVSMAAGSLVSGNVRRFT